MPTDAEFQSLLRDFRQLRMEFERLLKQHSDIWPPRTKATTDTATPDGTTLAFVNCTQTGGINGNESTKATWTYTVKDRGNIAPLATSASPVNPRAIGLTENPPTSDGGAWVGIASFDEDGAFVELFLVEPAYARPCPPDEEA